MRRLTIVSASGFLAALALAGCTAAALPTEPTPVPPAEARGPDSPLEIIDVYALCKAQTLYQIRPDDPSKVTWGSFGEAISLVRDDGYIGIYIEATNPNAPAGADTDFALECKVGGTIGAPDWMSFGVQTRESDRDVILANLAATDSA